MTRATHKKHPRPSNATVERKPSSSSPNRTTPATASSAAATPWTADEVRLLFQAAYLRQTVDIKHVATLLGRTPMSCSMKLVRLRAQVEDVVAEWGATGSVGGIRKGAETGQKTKGAKKEEQNQEKAKREAKMETDVDGDSDDDDDDVVVVA